MSTYTELAEALDAAKSDDDLQFVHLVNSVCSTLHIADAELARSLGISRPSVERWMSGRNLPLSLIRPQIFKDLARMCRIWELDNLKEEHAYAHAASRRASPRAGQGESNG